MCKAPSMPLFVGDYIADTTHLTMEQSGAYLQILMVTWRNGGRPLEDNDAKLARICRMTIPKFRDKVRPVIEGFFDLSEGTWRSPRLEREWGFVQKNIEVKRANGKLGGRPPSSEIDRNPRENLSKTSGDACEEFSPTRDDKPLENNETPKATGSFQLKLVETTQPQPQLNKNKKEKDSCSIGSADTNAIDALFEQFWTAIPKPWIYKPDGSKQAKANPKKPAKDKFIKLVEGGVDPEFLVAQAKQYAANLQDDPTDKPQFRPMVISWLNQHRWDNAGADAVDDTDTTTGNEVSPRWKTDPHAWSDINNPPPWPDAPVGTYCGRWMKASTRWMFMGARASK